MGCIDNPGLPLRSTRRNRVFALLYRVVAVFLYSVKMHRMDDELTHGRKVYVGNLDPESTSTELEEIFRRYGKLSNIWVARNPPGFAFVTFEDMRDARDAVEATDGILHREKYPGYSSEGSDYNDYRGRRGRSRSRSVDRRRSYSPRRRDYSDDDRDMRGGRGRRWWTGASRRVSPITKCEYDKLQISYQELYQEMRQNTFELAISPSGGVPWGAGLANAV
ncbi:Arginine/serine-rich splicing factor RSZ21 transcript II, related [Eimeria acervulina]|uniref:Arginine/serine-rich splicing factor RSZ21 transcript II, related n=1 Tax=Eimeria acervulina TaxID=5801 RepID=U6GJA0_EIMAC|nr:Arginine/serine-rich splicing factor RSZ21 transcript II, related [Eimeria acervulina]CDI78664.1 Arginine/serine-rich splicing factor RSZ21 transcript II, related [Eimeria acervulina]